MTRFVWRLDQFHPAAASLLAYLSEPFNLTSPASSVNPFRFAFFSFASEERPANSFKLNRLANFVKRRNRMFRFAAQPRRRSGDSPKD